MKTIDIVKNRLIDRIMVTNNEQLLCAIEDIFKSRQEEDNLSLNSYQIEMLMLSEKDIQQENLISESDLKEEDSKWMN